MVKDLIFKKPEEEGIPSSGILAVLKKIKDFKINLHSFMIVRHGNIIAEAYAKPFDKNFEHRLYSCSKTYVSIAIGKLIGEGKLKLSDKIADFFPEYVKDTADELILETTVEDALKMSVPMITDSYLIKRDENWAKSFFGVPSLKPSGTVFNYNTSGSFILGVLVEKITEKPFEEYLRPIFDEIGIGKVSCIKSPDGFSWGGSGIICTMRDFAKFGEFIMHKGEYNGKQLISREYMEKATSKQISNLTENCYTPMCGQGYGYQIWITDFGFGLYGMGSQNVFCYPDKDIMFVCNGDTQCSFDFDSDIILDAVNDYIYRPAKDSPLPEKMNSFNKLKAELDGFSLNVGYGKAHTVYESKINGVKYALDKNKMEIKWFKLHFTGDQGVFEYENKRGIKEIKFGLEKYVQNTFPETHYYGMQVSVPSNKEPDCIASASWTEEQKLLIRVYIIDTSFGNCFMTFGFKGDSVGIMMQKRAEFFMDKYDGYAKGKISK